MDHVNRFFPKKDKTGTHRRSKSSEPGSSKVMFPPRPLSLSMRRSETVPHFFRGHYSSSFNTICAAFPAFNAKSAAQVKATVSDIYATSANSQPRFVLQVRPISGNGILSLLKPAEKKRDIESLKKVAHPSILILTVRLLISCSFKFSSNDFKITE
jgi:hypothetical protein